MKKILFALLILIVFKCNISAFDKSIKLYDYAQIINQDEEQIIKKELNKKIDELKLDIIIVTVKYYNFKDVEEYADAFYSKNGFESNGIIFIIDLKSDGKYFIKGYGSESEKFTRDVTKKIYSKINSEKKYSDKCIAFINTIDKVDDIKNSLIYSNNKNGMLFYLFKYVIISIIIPTVIIIIIYLIDRKRLCNLNSSKNKFTFISEDKIKITSKNDTFSSTNTVSKSLKEKKA